MQVQALATIAYEVGDFVGDTSTEFMVKVKRYLNNRYEDALLRCGATMWTGASLGTLGDSDIPLLGLGKVIREGATSDALFQKRQYSKATVHDQKYEFALANYIISGDSNQFNISFCRYPTY
jgi:hypothetical protein